MFNRAGNIVRCILITSNTNVSVGCDVFIHTVCTPQGKFCGVHSLQIMSTIVKIVIICMVDIVFLICSFRTNQTSVRNLRQLPFQFSHPSTWYRRTLFMPLSLIKKLSLLINESKYRHQIQYLGWLPYRQIIVGMSFHTP